MERVAGDSLRCPICLDLPEDHVYQCRNGHVICRQCSENLRHCPQCRVEYETVKIRNRVLEDILDNMAVDCPYKIEGCAKTILRKELSQHRECCDFKPVEFCKLIGFTECNFSSHDGFTIFNHIRGKHSVSLIDSHVISLPKQSVNSSAISPLAFMKPSTAAAIRDNFLLCQHQTFGQGNRNTVSVFAIYFGKRDDSTWEMEYKIQDENGRNKYQWKMPPISFNKRTVHDYLFNPPFQIPIVYLEKTQAKKTLALSDVIVSIADSKFEQQTPIPKQNPFTNPKPKPRPSIQATVSRLNQEMVENLKLDGIIKSNNVMQLMRAVDRGLFISDKTKAYKNSAWKEGDIHLSSPGIYAAVLEALDLRPGLNFINIGSGSGYLSTMVGVALGENGFNYGIDCNSEAVRIAEETLWQFEEINNPQNFCRPFLCCGNFYEDYETMENQYDRVYCGAQCPKEDVGKLRKVIKDGGICIAPVDGSLIKIKRTSENEFESTVLMSVIFAPLVKSK